MLKMNTISIVLVIGILIFVYLKYRKEREKSFNTEKLTAFAIKEISDFAEKHKDETFYGFSIDANLLCMNSIEQFNLTLKHYEKKYDKESNTKVFENLKNNTGDWKYQGFAEFDDENGFNMIEYNEHYHENDDEQLSSEYAKAMNIVIMNLKESQVFSKFNKTENFFINRVEHNY